MTIAGATATPSGSTRSSSPSSATTLFLPSRSRSCAATSKRRRQSRHHRGRPVASARRPRRRRARGGHRRGPRARRPASQRRAPEPHPASRAAQPAPVHPGRAAQRGEGAGHRGARPPPRAPGQHHHPLAREVRGERLAARPAPREPLDLARSRRRPLGRQLVLGRARLQLVELKLQLVEKPLLALRAPAIHLAPQLLDGQLEERDLGFSVRDHRRRVRSPRLGLGGLCLGRERLYLGHRKGLPQRAYVGSAGHPRQRITAPDSELQQSRHPCRRAVDQPARDGRQLRTGFRQSIPSSR